MRKKSASGVLARHGRLTVSAAFTNVTRVIPRVVNLRSSSIGGWSARRVPCRCRFPRGGECWRPSWRRDARIR
ncbi:MAG: hypothetical protein E8D43_04665 [Nitrospira sp.]|nr:MAG: hypothetical protein E8D43_04665 [Nitrospira sp.]